MQALHERYKLGSLKLYPVPPKYYSLDHALNNSTSKVVRFEFCVVTLVCHYDKNAINTETYAINVWSV